MTRQFDGDTLLVASHNVGKIKEIRALFEPRGISIVTAADKNLAEPIETETTFEGNATLKARAASVATGLPALADDSGIEIDALDGAPGVYTADWAETPNGRDFVLAMTKTHNMLKDKPAPWTARFVSVLALYWPDGEVITVRGTVEGAVEWPMRGEMGFGYDPIFVPDGHSQTFAELGPDQKNSMSHRKQAFDKLIAACLSAR